MDLGLDIAPRTTGRAAKPVNAVVVRELTPEDLLLLQEEKGSRAPALQRLSERHHALARHLASGLKVSEAAAITGYDLSRVSILQSDPAFKELVLFYREDVNRQYAGLHEVMSGMSVDALITLRERLEDEPEKFKTAELLEMGKMGADRTGFGPSSKQELNVNVNLASRLEEARKRLANRVIDVTPGVTSERLDG